MMAVLCFCWFVRRRSDSSVAGPELLCFCDDHGGVAVVGRRDANWARSNSTITKVLLLSAVWVVGAVFANWNAPALALGGILN